MRVLSDNARESVLAEHGDEVMLIFLDLEIPGETIYVVNNTVPVSRGGNEYVAYDFDITVPDEIEEQMPVVVLQISNVDQVIIEALVSLTEPIPVSMNVALASSPDTVEAGPFDLMITGISWDDEFIRAELTFDDIMLEYFPGFRVTPGNHPAAF